MKVAKGVHVEDVGERWREELAEALALRVYTCGDVDLATHQVLRERADHVPWIVLSWSIVVQGVVGETYV